MESAMRQHVYTFNSKGLKTKLTAVEYFNCYILVGEGNTVCAYDTRCWSQVERARVFQENCVHGLRIKDGNAENEKLVAVFGGKSFCILKVQFSSSISLKLCKEEQQLEDWIWDIKWMADTELAAALAHNTVVLWDWITNAIKKRVTCEEYCILYSASLVGTSWQDTVCIAGTVYTEVIVWSVDSPENAKVLHRLQGHEGVIFCVTFNTELRLLCSTSDDRSLRLWKFKCESHNIWQNGKFVLLHILFGHESRVWKAVITNHHVISIGEDSVTCVWSHHGQLLGSKKYQGGGLLSLAVSEDEKQVVVGGGSLSVVDVDEILHSKGYSSLKLPQDKESLDFPRSVALCGSYGMNQVVVSTDKGDLLLYDSGQNQTWRKLQSDAMYGSYSVLSVSPNRDIIAWGNIVGELLLIQANDDRTFKRYQVHSGKVFNVLWLSARLLLTCGPEGKMILWNFSIEKEIVLRDRRLMTLPASKQRWPSAACQIKEAMLVVGDRVGNLHVYNESRIEQVQTCRSVHGRNGVTHLCCYRENVYSAGQDGCVVVHSVDCGVLQLLYTVKKPSRMEWIGRVVFTENDLLLLGFYTTNFSMWSHHMQRPILELSCGGGHRSWDLSLAATGEVDFVCIRKREIQLWNRSLGETHLRTGFHGNKIWCMVLLTYSENAFYVASGGEDNCIILSKLQEDDTGQLGIEHLERLGSHISSVRALASCAIPDGSSRLLVSAGGRAQVVLWMLIWDTKGLFRYRELANEFLWSTDRPNRKPWQNNHCDGNVPDPQTRYMDVAVWKFDQYFKVALGCSDACLRVYNFDINTCHLEMSFSVQMQFCILRLLLLPKLSAELLLTSATDGTIKFWNWSDAPTDPLISLAVHQNGINAIDACRVSDDKWVLATGGDDNKLAVNVISFSSSLVQVEASGSISTAHAAQIVGIRFLTSELLLSVALDQRLRLWKCTIGSDITTLEPIVSAITVVPDVAAMEILPTQLSLHEWKIIVLGEGMEVFHICKDLHHFLTK